MLVDGDTRFAQAPRIAQALVAQQIVLRGEHQRGREPGKPRRAQWRRVGVSGLVGGTQILMPAVGPLAADRARFRLAHRAGRHATGRASATAGSVRPAAAPAGRAPSAPGAAARLPPASSPATNRPDLLAHPSGAAACAASSARRRRPRSACGKRMLRARADSRPRRRSRRHRQAGPIRCGRCRASRRRTRRRAGAAPAAPAADATSPCDRCAPAAALVSISMVSSVQLVAMLPFQSLDAVRLAAVQQQVGQATHCE